MGWQSLRTYRWPSSLAIASIRPRIRQRNTETLGRRTGFTSTPRVVYDVKNHWRGPVAQLGARMTGSHEVESSNLSRSTNLIH